MASQDEQLYPNTTEAANVVFDNSGRTPVLVPGYGYEINVELEPARVFFHGFNEWAQGRLTARELAMLRLMNAITDKPGWHRDVHNAAAASRWAAEARSERSSLISEQAWAWCLAELRDKARYFEETGLVFVLNAGARMCKSDTLVPPDLLRRLASGAAQLDIPQLITLRKGPRDGSTTTTPSLVDPNWLPLMYGKTPVLAAGGRIGLLGCVEAMGSGSAQAAEPIAVDENFDPANQGLHRFSERFQWLPCEVAFCSSVGGTPGVRIESYINNLHPRRHRVLYEVIERFLEPAIRSWDELLMHEDKTYGKVYSRCRDPMRIQTYGAQWTPSLPEWAAKLAAIEKGTPEHEEAFARVQAYLEQPDQPASEPVLDIEVPTASTLARHDDLEWAVKRKYARVRKWVHPEPGAAYTYEDWKQGKVAAAVVPPREQHGHCRILRDHTYYTISLQHMFRKQGLQVVVEIGDVSLRPGDSPRGGTNWQLSGVLNDHIVATSVVYFSSENVTPDSGAISFRVEATMQALNYRYGADTAWDPYRPFEPLAGIFAFSSLRRMGNNAFLTGGPGDGPAVQRLGTVSTPDGRLVSFPNAVQHKVPPCALDDPTKPGRRRFLRLHLVDPHYRVLSMRNVPPQQRDWWMEAAWDKIGWAARRGVPPEIEAMIEDELGEWPLRRRDAERIWHDIRWEHRDVREGTIENIEPYHLAKWSTEGYEWPNQFPGEPEPPLDDYDDVYGDLDDYSEAIM